MKCLIPVLNIENQGAIKVSKTREIDYQNDDMCFLRISLLLSNKITNE